MHIREFTIDRFGVLHNQLVSDLPPGITVFLGDNEAGKSTCLNFFRAMLFGYARSRRSIDYALDSKALSATSGGSLLIESKDLGLTRLTRRPGAHGGPFTLSGPDGSPRPASDLALLLRGCTMDLYDKVFAFSLDELAQFGVLREDAVRNALHGAAFGTGLRSPGQVLKELEEGMKAIFAPRSTTATVPRLLDVLEGLETTLTERGSEVVHYAALQTELAGVDRDLNTEKDLRRALEKEQRDVGRQLAVRRRWEALRAARLDLAACPGITGLFAPDGRERLDKLEARLEDRKIALGGASAALSRLQSDLDGQALRADPALLTAHAPLAGLRERKESIRRSVAQLLDSAREQAACAAELTQECANLGQGWTKTRVAEYDLTLALREECSRLGRELSQAEQSAHGAEEALRRAEREYANADAALGALTAGEEPADSTDRADKTEQDSSAPAEEAIERLRHLLLRACDAHENIGPLALALRGATQALDQAISAVHPTWTRQNLDQVNLPLAERERLATLATAALATRETAQETERTRKQAESACKEARQRMAALSAVQGQSGVAQTPGLYDFSGSPGLPGSSGAPNSPGVSGLAKSPSLLVLPGMPDPYASSGVSGTPGAENEPDTAHSLTLRTNRLRRVQTACRALEASRRRHESANDQLNDVVTLVRSNGLRGKGKPPYNAGGKNQGIFSVRGLTVLSGVLALAAGGFALHTGFFAALPPLLYAGGGQLVLGLVLLALGLARPQAFSVTVDSAWQDMEQHLIQARQAARKAVEDAEAALRAALADDKELFPDVDFSPTLLSELLPELLADAEARLLRRRESLLLRERDAGYLEREKITLLLAEERLSAVTDARQTALAEEQHAADAWQQGLDRHTLPQDVDPQHLGLLLQKIDSALSRRATWESRAAESRDAEERISACQAFARTIAPLADLLASLPEMDSGLAPEPGAWLELVRHFIAEWREAGHERIRRRELKLERETRTRQTALTLDAAKQDLLATQQTLGARQNAWQDWLAAHQLAPAPDKALAAASTLVLSSPLPPALSPEGARLALDAVGKAKRALEQMQRHENRSADLRRDVAGFARALAAQAALLAPNHLGVKDLAVLADPDLGPPAPQPEAVAAVLALLDELAAKAAAAAEADLLRRNREKELPPLRQNAEAAQAQVAATEAEIAELLRLGLCDSAEAYRRAYGLWQQREKALAAEKTLDAALRQEATDLGLSLPALLETFATATEDDLAQRSSDREAALAQAGSREQTLAERRGGLAAAMNGLLSEAGLGELLSRRESLKEEIRREADHWSRQALAKELLLTAKRRFEAERQTGVVRCAGELFSAFTGGAYSGITVSLDDEAVRAVSRKGDVKNPENELSRGTREQLYLALRLAYVRDHGLQAEKLPVIMDDILVNFDSRRACNTAKVLADFAASATGSAVSTATANQQIFFFTCHESAADMLTAAAPAAARYVLREGMFQRA